MKLSDCLFCGAKDLPVGKGGLITGEHILKKSILESLGLLNVKIRQHRHLVRADEHWRDRHTITASGLKQPNICKTCNNDVFNAIDSPAEAAIVGLAMGRLRFADISDRAAEDLGWWTLKVGFVRSLCLGANVAPSWIPDLLLRKFRDGENVPWPSNAITFLVRFPDETKSNSYVNGSPCGYGSGSRVGSASVFATRYRQVMIGVAIRSFDGSDPVFVNGVHAPIFPRTAYFRLTDAPLISQSMIGQPENREDAALFTIGFVSIPDVFDSYFHVTPFGKVIEGSLDRLRGVSLPMEWRGRLLDLKVASLCEQLRLVERKIHPVGMEVRDADRAEYKSRAIAHSDLFLTEFRLSLYGA